MVGGQRLQPAFAAILELAERQHGVIVRSQLPALGCGRRTIEHLLASKRLHPIASEGGRWRGAYSVGACRPSRLGMWMAAVLSCGPQALLSHHSAAAHWRIAREPGPTVHVSVPLAVVRARPGIRAHRRSTMRATDRRVYRGIPITKPSLTLVDLAPSLATAALEAAVNDADVLGLIDPDALRLDAERFGRIPGAEKVRRLLDRRTFTLTDSELERLMLPILRSLDLPLPQTRARVNGFRVDFFWPELGLVIETDGLRYHRTAASQARDRVRDQAHTAAGLVPLRFTHAQVRYEPEYVRRTTAAVVARIRRG